MTFSGRPLSAPDTLGERLKQLREERRLTIDELGQKISVAPKYLQAIEEGRYKDLPGLVYARNFVRRYAAAMSLPEDSVNAKFEDEYQIVHGRREENPHLVQRANTDFPWYIRHSRFLLASAVVMVVAGYIIWQVVNLIQPPRLEVTGPASDTIVTTAMIMVTGQTDPEAQVRINNQSAEVAKDGTFDEKVELQMGLNLLKITSVRKHSRTAVIERRVLVESGD